MYEYREAIEAVVEFATENREKFMSSHEIVAAIILADNEVEAHIRYPINKHGVDFYLPKMKTVLEIDGYMHKHQRKQDSRRDSEVKSVLGLGWEVVRIPTRYIEQNAELLVEAIKTVREEKRKNKI